MFTKQRRPVVISVFVDVRPVCSNTPNGFGLKLRNTDFRSCHLQLRMKTNVAYTLFIPKYSCQYMNFSNAGASPNTMLLSPLQMPAAVFTLRAKHVLRN